jgi:hypothetical protein
MRLRVSGFFVFVLLLAAMPVFAADTVANGTVVSATASGGFSVRFPAGADVKPRDVFVITHAGKPLGECLVVSVKGTTAELLPKANFSGTAVRGDEAVFVRHAVAVTDIHDTRHSSIMPTWSHGDVKDADGWYAITVPEGPFEVHMPGQPEAHLSPTTCSWVYDDKKTRYGVIFLDLKPDMVKGLDLRDPDMLLSVFAEIAAGFAQEHGGQVSSLRLQPMAGCQGCAFDVDGGKPPRTHIEAQGFIVGTRLYQLIVESAPGASTNSKHFFSSMRLQKASAVATTQSNGWQCYTDEAGFSLSYPPDARFTKDPAEIARLMHHRSRAQSVRCLLVTGEDEIMAVSVERAPETMTTQALAAEVLDQAQKLPGAQVEGPTDDVLGGKSFVWVGFATQNLHDRCWVFVRPDTHEALIIHCIADPARFSHAAPTFQQILKSLSFNF